MSPEDRELLEDPAAKQVWDWLIERFQNVRLTPDSNVQLDLGVDSLEWLTLTLELRDRMSIELDAESIGRIQTVRDLLREASEGGKKTSDGRDPFRQLQDPENLLNDEQRRWLKPAGAGVRSLGVALCTLNRLLMRWAYHVEVQGLEAPPKATSFSPHTESRQPPGPARDCGGAPGSYSSTDPLGRVGGNHVQEFTDAANQSRHACSAD